MAELSQAARGYLEDIGRQPAARQPATLGEIWDSEWKRTGLDTITGLGKPLQDATEELRTAITTAAGKPLEDYAAERRVLLGAGATIDQRIKALNDLADTLPDEAKTAIAPLRDVRRRAMQSAQKIERDAADVSSATYGASGVATSWAAGIARQTSDFPNLMLMAATAPIGGPITGGAVKFIAGQAVAGAVSQAAIEPYVQPARAELGLESGIGRAAVNILEASVGGAVLGGAGVGLHRLFRAAANSYRGVQPGEGAAHPNLAAEDFDALAMHAERDAVIEPPAGADPVLHAERLTEASRAMEEGTPIERASPERPPTAPAQTELPLPEPVAPPVIPTVGGFIDTRGAGRRFHGSPAEITALDDDFYGSSVNYYGQGFYTTDAVDAAFGYAKRGRSKTPTLYEIKPKADAKIYDMEAPIAPEVRAKLDEMLEEKYGSTAELVEAALSEKPKNLRELFDAVRGYAASDRIPADEVQEGVFIPITDALGRAGFDAMSHRGGLLTKTPEHSVVIYFKPTESVTFTKVSEADVAKMRPEIPVAKPIEPKGPPAELKEPVDVIGNPVLAQDVERRLSQQADGDFEVHIEQADKTIKSGSAKAFLAEIQDDAKAVKELIDCIGQEPK